MDNEDREDTLYHGTTDEVAQLIVARQEFELIETYFASTKELAQFFAERSRDKHPRRGRPAVIRVVVYESDLKQWKANRLVQSKGFDEGDHPRLRGKTQLVFTPQAMQHLNANMFTDELAIVTF